MPTAQPIASATHVASPPTVIGTSAPRVLACLRSSARWHPGRRLAYGHRHAGNQGAGLPTVVGTLATWAADATKRRAAIEIQPVGPSMPPETEQVMEAGQKK